MKYQPLLRFAILLAPFIAPMICQTVAAAPSHPETRPNFVFILTDDQRDNSFSGMGHPWVKTPHVDKLLARSTRFRNAYIAEPTCKPSRAAIYLGCHERVNRHGFSSTETMSRAQWNDSFPSLLRKDGYHTGFVGKWHIRNERNLALEELFDHVEGRHGHGPFFFTEANGTEVTTNAYYTNRAVDFLRTIGKDNPFFLSVCLATPHGSKIPRMHEVLDEPSHLNPKLGKHPIYGGMYRDISFPIPFDEATNPYDHIPKSVMDQEAGRKRTYIFDYTEPMCREHHYRYYQMVTEIDEMVHRIVNELEATGLDDSTILIFASDHGLLMGEYGMGGKGLVYDLSSKFPCFVYDPSAPESAKGQVRDELVSSLDLSATILDYAGVEKTKFMYGASLRPLVRGIERVEGWRSGLFLENLYTGRDTPIQAGYVENGWKYIRYHKAPDPYREEDLRIYDREPAFEQLFDLTSDPAEMQNLIDRPEASETLSRLKSKTLHSLDQLDQMRAEYRNKY